jgi:hypothetical protein
MLKNVVFAYEYIAASTEEEPAPETPDVASKETIVKISCASEVVAEELVKKLKEKIPSDSDVFISYVN